jgi:hypothetical protein
MHDLYRNLLLAITDDFRIGDGTKRTDAAIEAMEQAGIRRGGPYRLEVSKSVAHLVDPKIEDVRSDIEKSAAAVRLEMRKRHNELFDKIVGLETALSKERSRVDGNVKDICTLLDGFGDLKATLGTTRPVVETNVEDIDDLKSRVKALEDVSLLDPSRAKPEGSLATGPSRRAAHHARPKPDPEKVVNWEVVCPECADSWTWIGPGRPQKVKCRRCGNIIERFYESKKEWQPLKIKCRCGVQYEVPSGTSAEDIPSLCPRCDQGLMSETFPLTERLEVADRWGRTNILVGINEAHLISALPRGPKNIEELRTLEALEHDIIGKIDWKLISKQKRRLVELVRGGTLSEQFREAVRGIVHLIDALEDWHDAER